MDKHSQASPDPVDLRVSSQGQVETVGQGGEGVHGVSFRSLLRSPVHVQRGERKRTTVAEQVQLPRLAQEGSPSRPCRCPLAGCPCPLSAW